MNNLTRYPIILYRPKAKDIARLDERLGEGIRAAFTEEGIPAEVTEEYLRIAGHLNIQKRRGESGRKSEQALSNGGILCRTSG